VQQTAEAEGLAVAINSGGSNTLVRQAELGAKTDLLLLADDKLAREALLPRGYSVQPIAGNQLVVIAASHAGGRVDDFRQALAGSSPLAVADPLTAPLGSYTLEALQGLSLTRTLLPLQDAQAVLSAVSLGHAPSGIVYRSDAASDPRVTLVATLPSNRHRPIVYVAALPPQASPSARRLVDSLRAGQGRDLLSQHGFLPAPEHEEVRAR
jgi:molybdate transport system substrate-binding protein